MVSRVGFEPTTDRLKGGCSTAELTARRESSTGPGPVRPLAIRPVATFYTLDRANDRIPELVGDADPAAEPSATSCAS